MPSTQARPTTRHECGLIPAGAPPCQRTEVNCRGEAEGWSIPPATWTLAGHWRAANAGAPRATRRAAPQFPGALRPGLAIAPSGVPAV